MRSSRITLRVTQGNLEDPQYVFEEPMVCIVGRAEDCNIHIPTDYEHADISRHHCLIEISPPRIRVRDLGSRNGTFVNGKKIGQRPVHLPPELADLNSGTAQELHDGDEIRVGTTVFRIGVAMPREALLAYHES